MTCPRCGTDCDDQCEGCLDSHSPHIDPRLAWELDDAPEHWR